MVRRPIIWGLIFFGIGAVGWVFSVVLAVVSLGKLKILANIFGIVFALSLPVTGIWELILWFKNPPSHKASAVAKAMADKSEGKGKNK